jgi:Fe-S cluster biosynthesis and repair protein YggX
MSNLAILHSPNSSNILNNFSATPQAQKQKIRTLIGQGVKNNIDFSNFLTEANAKIANQISKDSRSGGQIEKTINDWHEKVAMANKEHRRNLRNLGQNLASSVGFSYGSDGNQ